MLNALLVLSLGLLFPRAVLPASQDEERATLAIRDLLGLLNQVRGAATLLWTDARTDDIRRILQWMDSCESPVAMAAEDSVSHSARERVFASTNSVLLNTLVRYCWADSTYFDETWELPLAHISPLAIPDRPPDFSSLLIRGLYLRYRQSYNILSVEHRDLTPSPWGQWEPAQLTLPAAELLNARFSSVHVTGDRVISSGRHEGLTYSVTSTSGGRPRFLAARLRNAENLGMSVAVLYANSKSGPLPRCVLSVHEFGERCHATLWQFLSDISPLPQDYDYKIKVPKNARIVSSLGGIERACRASDASSCVPADVASLVETPQDYPNVYLPWDPPSDVRDKMKREASEFPEAAEGQAGPWLVLVGVAVVCVGVLVRLRRRHAALAAAVVTCATTWSCGSGSSTIASSRLVVVGGSERTVDLRTTPLPQDRLLPVSYVLENRGPRDVRLLRAETSCACLRPSGFPIDVPAGGMQAVTFRVRPAEGTHGVQREYIRLICAHGESVDLRLTLLSKMPFRVAPHFVYVEDRLQETHFELAVLRSESSLELPSLTCAGAAQFSATPWAAVSERGLAGWRCRASLSCNASGEPPIITVTAAGHAPQTIPVLFAHKPALRVWPPCSTLLRGQDGIELYILLPRATDTSPHVDPPPGLLCGPLEHLAPSLLKFQLMRDHAAPAPSGTVRALVMLGDSRREAILSIE